MIVPMVTPVTNDGELDERGIRRVVGHLLAGGVDVIFPAGTTGEASSLTAPMRSRLVAVVVEAVAGHASVFAGIGSNALGESLAMGKEYLARGVDAVVAPLPSYYSLNDEEQYAYFHALLEGVGGPLILYNIPSTTHMLISVDVTERLAQHPNAIGIKDSAADPTHLAALLMRLGPLEGFSVFVGSTALASKGLSQGAEGFVPSAGNLAPTVCRHLYEAVRVGDWERAKKQQATLDAIGRVYQGGRSLGQSIAALKGLMHEAGLCGSAVLPPLQPVDSKERARLQKALRSEGLSLMKLVH